MYMNTNAVTNLEKFQRFVKIWWLKGLSTGLVLKPGYAIWQFQSERDTMVKARGAVQTKKLKYYHHFLSPYIRIR